LTTHTTLWAHCILQTGGHLAARLVTVGSSGINFWGMTLAVGKHASKKFQLGSDPVALAISTWWVRHSL